MPPGPKPKELKVKKELETLWDFFKQYSEKFRSCESQHQDIWFC